MNRTFLKILTVIGFILIFQIPFLSPADDAIPPEVLSAAQEGIEIFLKDAQTPSLYEFGFSGKEEANNATVGKGFEVFTVTPDSLLSAGASQDLASLAISTNQWEFVIEAGGKAKVLLTVAIMNGRWTPVAIGSSGLAKEVGKALATYPAAAGFNYQWIRIYQATSDLLEISSGRRVLGILPFSSGRRSMDVGGQGFSPQDLYSSEDVISRLQPVVRKNLETNN
jgi:hypothetical protein